MGLGVLECHGLDHVPGTVLLNDLAAHTEDVTGTLKHGTGKDAHIVLSPQPSEDPNDPLNWPLWKKEFIVLIMCMGCVLSAGVGGVFLNASFFEVAVQVNKPITAVVLTSGYTLLAAGISGPFVCAFSRKYGKRHVFIASTLFAIIGTAIGESHISYEYLLAARTIQGLAISAYESLTIACVGDMYFVHQRGVRIALLNFVINAASGLAQIICGQVFQSLGYLWLFHMFQIFLILQLVLLFLFCPETTYIRDERYNTDTVIEEKYAELTHIEAHGEKHTASESFGRVQTEDIPKKKTFVQQLAIFGGVYSKDSLIKFLVGPFLTLLNPAACYSTVCCGILTTWFVGSQIILSTIFTGLPWKFNAAQVGYLGTGPFVGGMLGAIVVGVSSDPIIKFMTKRNNGTYEPEFRLVFMSLAGVTSGLGMFLFGYATSIGAAAELCAFLQGLLMFGVLVGIFSTVSYGLDAFRAQSSEIFIMNMVLKNFLFYSLSTFANDWVIKSGPIPIMFVFGGTSIFLALLTIPVYMYGKRLRGWWSRHDLFVLLKMQTTGPKLDLA